MCQRPENMLSTIYFLHSLFQDSFFSYPCEQYTYKFDVPTYKCHADIIRDYAWSKSVSLDFFSLFEATQKQQAPQTAEGGIIIRWSKFWEMEVYSLLPFYI